MEIIRKNRFGEEYILRQEVEYDGTLTGRTTIQTGTKSITVDHTIDKVNMGWYAWLVQGKFIQDAFPFLNADEREFLMTSLTTDEWAKLFGTEIEKGEKNNG